MTSIVSASASDVALLRMASSRSESCRFVRSAESKGLRIAVRSGARNSATLRTHAGRVNTQVFGSFLALPKLAATRSSSVRSIPQAVPDSPCGKTAISRPTIQAMAAGVRT